MRLVADANVLLSAIGGGRARLALGHPMIEGVCAADAVYAELREYLGSFARRKGIPEDVMSMALATLPVTWVDGKEYEARLSEASRRIGGRDSDDVDTLALAIHLKAPIWSNDHDFDDAGVQVYPTAKLLSLLGVRRRPGV
ncbi:MAG: PIN domain-containing protein [Acidobacteriota bacterium]